MNDSDPQPAKAIGGDGSASLPDDLTATGAGPSRVQGPGVTRNDLGGTHEGPGTRIGTYKILQQLGEGGFGTVFMAEQEKPVRRIVALKIIKLGMDTRQVVARFEAERQALALMDHPHIARVLDAGATETGRPYFVMDLVKGEPIGIYCNRHKLSVVERLALFDQVCQAVQHAHAKGIIHRDLKPTNVLVSTQEDQPFAKVIDFGIAKATSGNLTDMTLFTAHHQMIGTPLYMSPEQADGSMDIDTRTDIYSLGVLLYELLTDKTPFDSNTVRSAGLPEMQRIIREVEPVRPSVRLSKSAAELTETAAKRQIEPGRLTRLVRGELDWIVMKAIEKERTRRYETANGLAMDVRRYLAGQPVLAAPPSRYYRLQKFVRRNKVATVAGLLVAAALVAGIIGFAWQARIAGNRAAELEKVARFQAEMLAQVDPNRAGKLLSDSVRSTFAQNLSRTAVPESDRARQIDLFAGQWSRVNATDAARELIDRTILKPAVEAIDKQFKDQPLVGAALRQVLADRYREMGLFVSALTLQQRALETRRRVLGDKNRDTLVSIYSMGKLLQADGKPGEAEPYYRESLQVQRRVLGEEHPETLRSMNGLGTALDEQDRLTEAEPYYRDSLEKRRRALGEEHPETIESINDMGSLLQDQGKLSEAEVRYREAVERGRRILGEEHPQTLIYVSNLGGALLGLGKLSEAETYYRESLDKSRRVLGEDHPDTLISISVMGLLLQSEGKLDESESLMREALEKRLRVLGPDNPATLKSIASLGSVLREQGKLSEAESYLRDAMDKRLRLFGRENLETLASVGSMGRLLTAQGKHADAVKLLVPFEAARRGAFSGDNATGLARFLTTLGIARAGTGEFTQAEINLLEAHSLCTSLRNQKPKETRDIVEAIVDLYNGWNTAAPGKGYDAKAAEWKAKLEP